MTRRRLLGAGGLVAAGLSGAAFGAQHLLGKKAEPARPRHLNITAHPDDDLYFFNPDLQQEIKAGVEVLSICLTTGEADGRNFPSGDSRIKDQPVRFHEYAAARQHGLRSAYARMAAGDADSPWKRELVTARTGAPMEVATLIAEPRIRLVFLDLWNEADKDPGYAASNVRLLWSGEAQKLHTMQPAGSPMQAGYTHSRQSLLDTLVELITDFKPDCVRLMDPDPDFQVHDADHPQNSDSGDYSDNADHTAAGLFGWAALQEHWRRGGGGVADSYRGYYNQRWPQNLSEDAYKQKLDLLATYGGLDGRPCTDPIGCGDLKLGNRAASRQYGWSTTHRYGSSATWVHPAQDGRLNVFAVQGGRVVRWAEETPGAGKWASADVPGGGDLLPHLAVNRNAAGGLQVFGVRMVLDADPGKQARELVTIGQTAGGDGFGDWTGLGNPHDGERNPARRRRVGMPAVGRYADGRLALFVRNGGTGLSCRIQAADGTWRPWSDLGGSDTQDGLSVVTTASGLVEVYAAIHGGVLRWFQETAAGPWRRQTVKVTPPAAPPTVLTGPGGRLTMLVREGTSTEVLAYGESSSGVWNLDPQRLRSEGGFGTVAGAQGLIASRNKHGTVSVRFTADKAWAKAGLGVFHSPAVALDSRQRPVVVALDRDGQPRARRWVAGKWSSERFPSAARRK
ncbi:PIG-L family deacetylase [Paractinoplanes globisporus]|uniref:PIG-L family deacetylase n=1 Tax=Paractinoplanes globisporus TaxID=113565 RepID=A0ABW6WDU6_9ACTN|nr:PIG-L family deacetylase [Actinoplanes globisporus]